MQRALGAAIINFCIVIIHCNNVTVLLTLGETKSVDVSNGKTLSIKCKLNSGSFDATQSRSWVANGVPLIDDGISSTAGSGYTESLQADGFTLVTPTLTHTFDGTRYQCSYGFSQANLDVRIYGIGRTDQSKGDCIDGKSVNNCWFSLSTVIPEVSSENLTISYEDGTMEDIKSLLNITSQLNADGKTRDYVYKITPASFSMDVKTIKLSFFANPISRTLTIVAIKDCSLDIFLYGFLPDFLIVLIVSIVIIIILKIECLPKQFGGLTWKKLGIIAVCFVVAIIIGVCLGLLIKGCDNKLLALCLSLLFGILLVVALISALIYYHKKFESRRDIQDGGAQDGNGSSQNNTGSNTTRTTTERVGSPASTSNVELAANLKSEY